MHGMKRKRSGLRPPNTTRRTTKGRRNSTTTMENHNRSRVNRPHRQSPKESPRFTPRYQLIEDFFDLQRSNSRSGAFAGNTRAEQFAQGIGKRQTRQWNRYQIVPVAFFGYLKAVKAIPDRAIPDHARTVYVLLDLLWQTIREGSGNVAEADAIRTELLKDFLTLKIVGLQSGSAQKIIREGELYCRPAKSKPVKPKSVLQAEGGA